MKKIIHDAATGKASVIDIPADELARIREIQQQIANRPPEPTPGADLLALAESSRNNAELRLVVIELIRRVYGLPAPAPEPVEEPPVEAQGAKG